MTLDAVWRLLVAGCLFLLVGGCLDDGGVDGGGGAGGAGGFAGTVAAPPQVPGLWEGEANGVSVCFYVGQDGLALTPSPECDVNSESGTGSNSFDLGAELVGTNENGQRCSFQLGYTDTVTIDRATSAFRITGYQRPDTEAVLSFSGELTGRMASGVARSESGESFCQVGWAANTAIRCDEAAIQTCLALQNCCRAILVNPVFFQSCNSVVLQCDEVRCQELLDGYPQCGSVVDPPPEPVTEQDAGTSSAGSAQAQ